MVASNLNPLGVYVPYRKAVSPAHMTSSFLGDDTDNHDFRFPGGGKPVLNVVIDNAPNQILTCQLYGAPAATSEIGEAGVVSLDDAAWTVALATGQEEGYIGWAYPFYILRCAFSVTPTDNPKKTVSIWVNLSGGGL